MVFSFSPTLIYADNNTKLIKILLVPGHDNQVWGAEYGNMKEADMTLDLATRVYNILKKDKRFEVYITRDQTGYTKTFADYFAAHRADIISFKENARKEIQKEVTDGGIIQKSGVPHASISADTSVKLYGINKWADENNIDAVINVHFDDYYRPDIWTIGKYKGFTVYFPDPQMPNAKESAPLASNIFGQLSKKYDISNFKDESKGLVSDQKLIALGADDTLNTGVRSVLIEYGYIYQKIFRDTATRHQAYKTMASLTAKGIENYFLAE